MRGRIDEVGETQQSGGEPNSRPVEGGDEDLGVRVKGLRDVEVVGDKVAQPLAVWVFAGDGRTAYADICAAGGMSAGLLRDGCL